MARAYLVYLRTEKCFLLRSLLRKLPSTIDSDKLSMTDHSDTCLGLVVSSTDINRELSPKH